MLPNKELLFENISFSINNHHKTALIGNNGSGKSTLLRIIANDLLPSSGQLNVDSKPFYVPQIFGQYDHLTIAQVLRIEGKLDALHAILEGDATEENLHLLNDDWTIEDRCREALDYWRLDGFHLTQRMETLSGGEKTKVFLAGISIHQPELILLDEPSNHLDISSRQLLYDLIQSTKATMIVVSHDRKLLNLLDTTLELSKGSVTTYSCSYDFYAEQKRIEGDALNHAIQNQTKTLRKAKEKERETLERQQRLDSRGKKKQEKAGVARIMMNTFRNKAENSTSKIKGVHAEKIDGLSEALQVLRATLPDIDKMKFGFDSSALHKGKILATATNINFNYNSRVLWKENLTFSNQERRTHCFNRRERIW